MRAEYREEPCKSALNRVKGMMFDWSLNPYMGCVHRCTFCYVRAFERRADRPSDDRYGRTIRVKTNVVEVLRHQLDPEIWQTTEPGTAPPRQRLRALKTLTEAGIRASVGMAPILPGLSDKPKLLAEVVCAAREAGATGIWANLLHLRPGTREHFLDCLSRDCPELLPRYEQLYARGRAYLPAAEQEPVRSEVARLRKEIGIADRRAVRLVPEPRCEQLRIAV